MDEIGRLISQRAMFYPKLDAYVLYNVCAVLCRNARRGKELSSINHREFSLSLSLSLLVRRCAARAASCAKSENALNNETINSAGVLPGKTALHSPRALGEVIKLIRAIYFVLNFQLPVNIRPCITYYYYFRFLYSMLTNWKDKFKRRGMRIANV